MPNFIYLRGKPATGKVTVARLLEKNLGYKLFWFHDLKNAVFGIVKQHRIPRLMDELTTPVLKFLLENGDDIIFVRPSPDKETVESVLDTLKRYLDYQVHVVTLDASYDTLLARAEQRDDPFRISNKADLDEYVNSRTTVPIEGEHTIMTDTLTPDQVAKKIKELVMR